MISISKPESCFGYSFQTGSVFSAALQLILAAILLAFSIERVTSSERLDIPSATIAVIQIFQIISAFFLFEGSKERNHRRCKIWFGATIILTVLTTICLVYEFYEDSTMTLRKLSYFHFLSLTSILSNFCFLFVTFWLIQQLGEEDEEGGYNLD